MRLDREAQVHDSARVMQPTHRGPGYPGRHHVGVDGVHSTCENCGRAVPDGATQCQRCGKKDYLKSYVGLFFACLLLLPVGPGLWLQGNPILAVLGVLFGAAVAFSVIFFGGMFLATLFGKVTPVGGFAPVATVLPAAIEVEEDGPPPETIVDEPLSLAELAELDKRLAPPPP